MSTATKASAGAANTVTPTDGMVITTNVVLKPGVYVLPNGLSIAANDITVEGAGVTIVGVQRQGVGVTITGRNGVTLRGLKLMEYYHGVKAQDCEKLLIENCCISGTAEVPDNTIFLNIWHPAETAYGAAIMLQHVADSDLRGNTLMHQMNGVLAYECQRLRVVGNNANYNSGFGFHLNATCDSLYEENWADYCNRYQPRDRTDEKPNGVVGAGHHGHMGADATGFLIINKSCRNVFRRNFARCGGDGFFLAGRSPQNEDVGCNDNLFEENDGSLSPNIAFEATFSSGNVFRNNWADRCNYGFWLGFSKRNIIEGNRMLFNRQAGIAVENGCDFVVKNNDFQANGHGILLWSKYVAAWHDAIPETRTSHDWEIVGNKFARNGVAVAIYADKDHGIRPAAAEDCGKPELRPYNHVLRGNDIQDNRVGVHLQNTDKTTIHENKLNANVEANLRLDDDRETSLKQNLGSAGAYL